MDGSSQTLSRPTNTGADGPFGSFPLYLMSRGGSSLFGAGRMAAVGLWSRLLNTTEIGDLAAGALPTSVPSGLVASWRMSVAGATETDTSGNGNTLNYTGTTVVSDPPSLSGGTGLPPGMHVTIRAI